MSTAKAPIPHVDGDAAPARQAKRQETEATRYASEVCVVGAGPAGLMLGLLLARFGIDVEILDDRANKTSAGRADGLQPKTIETLRQLGLADGLLQKGARIYDICFWESTGEKSLRRTGREVHYPPDAVDLLDNYILLVHQGMVEDVFIQDLKVRGVEVKRNYRVETVSHPAAPGGLLGIECALDAPQHFVRAFSRYVVGCDGARSKVRDGIPDTQSVGKSHESTWGVLDGELVTDFPDIWSKSVVYSQEHGSILIIPRERNLTRFYIEIKASSENTEVQVSGQSFVMERAKAILAPYSVHWATVEWFGNYQVRQRVARRFANPELSTFIAGDAAHTHSPKAAQGMNTSMHDTWNLAWKLNLVIRGLAKPALLETYERERGKIAHDLISFDYEHANKIAGGDAKALAENFRTNVRFISGVGVEYDPNVLNQPSPNIPVHAGMQVGCLVPPAKVTRYIDANPVDVQLDIPVLGQFRLYFLTPDVVQSMNLIGAICAALQKPDSFIARVNQAAATSYKQKPRGRTPEDDYTQPARYLASGQLITPALITQTNKADIEIASLPPLFAQSPWTFYLDNVPHLDTRNTTCISKWAGDLADDEVFIASVRPDGYVGTTGKWRGSHRDHDIQAAKWLQEYYEGFLQLA